MIRDREPSALRELRCGSDGVPAIPVAMRARTFAPGTGSGALGLGGWGSMIGQVDTGSTVLESKTSGGCFAIWQAQRGSDGPRLPRLNWRPPRPASQNALWPSRNGQCPIHRTCASRANRIPPSLALVHRLPQCYIIVTFRSLGLRMRTSYGGLWRHPDLPILLHRAHPPPAYVYIIPPFSWTG